MAKQSPFARASATVRDENFNLNELLENLTPQAVGRSRDTGMSDDIATMQVGDVLKVYKPKSVVKATIGRIFEKNMGSGSIELIRETERMYFSVVAITDETSRVIRWSEEQAKTAIMKSGSDFVLRPSQSHLDKAWKREATRDEQEK